MLNNRIRRLNNIQLIDNHIYFIFIFMSFRWKWERNSHLNEIFWNWTKPEDFHLGRNYQQKKTSDKDVFLQFIIQQSQQKYFNDYKDKKWMKIIKERGGNKMIK